MIASDYLGHAGQPGYVIQPGDAVTVTKASNLPQGGYFIENCKTGNSIHVTEAELGNFVREHEYDLFKRRGCGERICGPVFIGKTWTLEAERVDGHVQAYATHAVSARTYDYNPGNGRVAPAGLPGYVVLRLRKLLRSHNVQAK